MKHLSIIIQPNAKRSEIVGPYQDSIKIKIAAPATEGKANEALITFLSKWLNIPKSAIFIRHGHQSRKKRIEIQSDIPTDWFAKPQP